MRERASSNVRGAKPDDVLGRELLAEQAANLGRLGRQLQRELDRLRAFERGSGSTPSAAYRTRRSELVVAAAEALFLYVVQREVCGFRDTAGALDVLGVPREVRLRMGPRSTVRGVGSDGTAGASRAPAPRPGPRGRPLPGRRSGPLAPAEDP